MVGATLTNSERKSAQRAQHQRERMAARLKKGGGGKPKRIKVGTKGKGVFWSLNGKKVPRPLSVTNRQGKMRV